MRFNAFSKTQKTIEESNAKGHSYILGHNQFSDWTQQEYDNFLNFRSTSKPSELVSAESVSDVQEIDWTTKGAVQKVKDQKGCGSCWAFSAIGAIESAHFIASGELEDFSEQQLVDCDDTCYGCSGGLMKNAFKYFIKGNKLVRTLEYPYEAVNGVCRYDGKTKTGTTVLKSNSVKSSVNAMKEALSIAPVAIGIQAGQDKFRQYQRGILTDCQGTRLDHGVLLVGWGIYKEEGEADQEFWKIKNSWGVRWGEDGFIRVAIEPGTSQSWGLLKDADYVTTN